MLHRTGRVGAAAVALILAATLAACDDAADPGPPPPPEDKIELTLGVYGSRPEVVAYESAARAFNATSAGAHVTVQSWPDHDTAIADIKASGDERPDIFMSSRRDLAWLEKAGANAPVDELLDSRGVTFSDDYSRDALDAFSGDSQLQCMPYSISPMVIYYNTKLVDFDKMAERDLDVPSRQDRWSFEQFAAAAQFADRSGKGIGGLHIDPTLPGLAPFIYSGGGQIFDDPLEPTTLAFSSDDTQAALEETLAVLRDPGATLTTRQLEKRSGLEWFKRGKLGMIAGLRDLVPQLRDVQGLEFDVLPMPVLGEPATVGDVTGLCMSAQTADMQAAADLLAHLVSDEQVAKVARAGYIVPARLSVVTDVPFLQPGQYPENAEVYQSTLRTIVVGPLLDNGPELDEAVQPYLRDMFTEPVLNLPLLGEEIDAASTPLLNPDEEGTQTPDDEGLTPSPSDTTPSPVE